MDILSTTVGTELHMGATIDLQNQTSDEPLLTPQIPLVILPALQVYLVVQEHRNQAERVHILDQLRDAKDTPQLSPRLEAQTNATPSQSVLATEAS